MVSFRRLRVAIPISIIFYFLANETSNRYYGISSSDSETETSNNTTQHSTNNTITYITIDKNNISLPSAKSLLDTKQYPSPYEEVDIYRLSSNLTKSKSTIVTAYFKLNSKHGESQYTQWMENFLSIKDHMVIYTFPELLPQIKQFRSHALDRTVIILMNVNDLPLGTLYPNELWVDQFNRDYEKDSHKDYRLFWIWLNKIWHIQQSIQHNFFGSEIYMWADIGCFRDGSYNSKMIIQHDELIPRDEILMQSFKIRRNEGDPFVPQPPQEVNFFDNKKNYMNNFYHAGSMMAGYKETWHRYWELFLEMVDTFLKHQMILCDDQVILQSVCMTNPEICAYVLATEVYPKDKRYHILRYVLHHGGSYNFWRKEVKTTVD